jgi:hypothetical protein
MHYKEAKFELIKTAGVNAAFKAMRLPKDRQRENITFEDNLILASKLVKAGDDHAKAMRGIVAWVKMECQVGWLIEYLTYRKGIECLSSSSSMHNELASLVGQDLADKKQEDLSEKVYTRIEMISYQAFRHMYKARMNHRHPDWKNFCLWMRTTLPHFDSLIVPEIKDVRIIH